MRGGEREVFVDVQSAESDAGKCGLGLGRIHFVLFWWEREDGGGMAGGRIYLRCEEYGGGVVSDVTASRCVSFLGIPHALAMCLWKTTNTNTTFSPPKAI
mgnify:FL=1